MEIKEGEELLWQSSGWYRIYTPGVMGSMPGQETKTPHAMQYGQEKKKKKTLKKGKLIFKTISLGFKIVIIGDFPGGPVV